MRISKNTIYSICISIGFIIFAFIINVYLGFIILLSFLPVLPTFVRKKDNDPAQAVYTRKDFLTYNEKLFYRKLLPLSNDYIIIPQVNLASVIQKESAKYRTELFRNIDFGIFSKDFELLLLIELNDKSHMKRNRKIRDNKIKNILYLLF